MFLMVMWLVSHKEYSYVIRKNIGRGFDGVCLGVI